MSVVSIAWDEAAPAGSESIGQGDNRIRSLKTDLRTGLDAEHIWPTSGPANAGAHRAGSARAFYGTQSQVSSSDTAGRIMITSNTSRLMSVASISDSSVFMLGAGPLTPSFGSWLPVSYGTANQTKGIAMEAGTSPGSDTVAQHVVTFASAFDAAPFMLFNPVRSNESDTGSHAHFNAASITASGFSGVVVEDANGGGVSARTATTVHWLAIGTRNL